MDYEIIDINDERAKELAQILMNDKAIAILQLISEKPLSISEISRELNLPISTVSYHIDKMMRVGLVKVAGTKYGRRLQEVKLYEASDSPILLLPKRSAAKIRKRGLIAERLHVISLSLAFLASLIAYGVSRVLFGGFTTPQSREAENLSVMYAAEKSPLLNQSEAVSKVISSTQTSTEAASGPLFSSGWLPAIFAVSAFLITFLLVFYLGKRKSREKVF
ncbi:MAG: hypothetical protein PWQ79_1880 [Thermococcaceae archaeon]|nr:hypothetical protein [Thermococcaceae archaeon]MDK2914965.1 hypothetical protein [Thermococcaceae archaeon]